MSQKLIKQNDLNATKNASFIELRIEIHLTGSCAASLVEFDKNPHLNPRIEFHNYEEDLVQLMPHKGNLV